MNGSVENGRTCMANWTRQLSGWDRVEIGRGGEANVMDGGARLDDWQGSRDCAGAW